MTLMSLVLMGMSLGLAYAAVPGPVNTETIRRGLALGFRPALNVQIGALLGDCAWAILGLTGAFALTSWSGVGTALELVGAVFLLILARDALCSARASRTASPAPTTPAGKHLLVGLTFSLANPVGIAFWAGLGGGLVARIGDPTAGELGVILASFLGALLAWSVALPAVVGMGRRPGMLRLMPVVDTLCAAILGWFGVSMLVDGIEAITG
ncbi:MAG TPA: LysE family transporter [Thermomicrobiales bacterium]|nr:LysE family transporter [Thermomicrobiales bacterium]